LFKRNLTILFQSARTVVVLLFLTISNVSHSAAQQAYFWSQQERIPDYPDFTQEPPFLVADQNNTIHAFNSQPLQLDDDNSPEAIFYRQWTEEGGWTVPNDIIFDSTGGSVKILGVAHDSANTVYLIYQQDFFDIYFTSAHLTDAGNSNSWSQPVLIAGQATHVAVGFAGIAAIATDKNANVLVIYSGSEFGKGLYSVKSSDLGVSWSDPEPVYLTGDETVVVTDPDLIVGQSGNFHAVWSTFADDGSAGLGYYSRTDADAKTWTEPMELDSEGIRTPSIVEYGDQLIVSYYHANVNGNWWRLSNDGGNSWSFPNQLSPRHVGTNGRISFVVDSKNVLHAFFGERINDLNHGMWETVWTDYSWTNPEPVAKGPQVVDVIGGAGFDPRAARAIISNGNLIMVTWATDGFAGENGAWYSYKYIDAPQLPAVVLEAPTSAQTSTLTDFSILPTPQATMTAINDVSLSASSPEFIQNPQTTIIFGVVPVLLLLLATILMYSLFQNKNK